MSNKLLILLGASEFPKTPSLTSAAAFARSYAGIKEYCCSSEGFGLPPDNILDLFETEKNSAEIDDCISEWLRERVGGIEGKLDSVTDLIVYYVGHGGFKDESQDYYLAIRSTRERNPYFHSIPLESLAKTLREDARHLRRYIILDACFAGAAARNFMSPVEDIVKQRIDELNWNDEAAPTAGTVLLCASSKHDPARYLDDGHTMFSGALLRALRVGDARVRNRLSAQDLHKLTWEILRASYNDKAVRPELHTAEQRFGNISFLPFFPNPQMGSIHSAVQEAAEDEISGIDAVKAIKIVESMPKEQTKELTELLSVYELHKAIGWITDTNEIIEFARSAFTDPVLTTREKVQSSLQKASQTAANFEKTGHWEDDWECAKSVIGHIVEPFPSETECFRRLLAFERWALAPFLIREWHSPHHLHHRSVVEPLLQAGGFAREALPIWEVIIRGAKSTREFNFMTSVEMAQKALGDDFESWYVKVRGKTFEEEIAEATRAEELEEETRNQEASKRAAALEQEALALADHCKKELPPDHLLPSLLRLVADTLAAANRIKDKRGYTEEESKIWLLYDSSGIALRGYFPEFHYTTHIARHTYTEWYATEVFIRALVGVQDQMLWEIQLLPWYRRALITLRGLIKK